MQRPSNCVTALLRRIFMSVITDIQGVIECALRARHAAFFPLPENPYMHLRIQPYVSLCNGDVNCGFPEPAFHQLLKEWEMGLVKKKASASRVEDGGVSLSVDIKEWIALNPSTKVH